MVVPRFTGFTLGCLALVVITAVGASAATIYTTPASDGWAQEWTILGPPGVEQTAYTYETYALVINNEYIPAEHSMGLYERAIAQGILQFPISSLGGVTLLPNSAKLNVYFQPSTSVSSVELSGFNYDGGGNIVYSQIDGARTSICSVSPTPSTWWQVDVTGDLQRQINAGYTWAGFYFTTPYTLNGPQLIARVSTYEDSSHRPYLDLVPEPGGLLALGSGLLALCGAIRRRK